MKIAKLLQSRLLLIVIAVLAGWTLRVVTSPSGTGDHDRGAGAEAEAAAPTFWTCSMDPQVQAPVAGLCPICGMDLIPMTGTAEHLGPRQLRLSEAALALADIRTAAVERRAIGREVRLAGRIEADQTRETVVSNWMPGTLERVFVNASGVSIRKGDHLVELYHPDLLIAERELLDAADAERALGEDPPEGRAKIAAARLQAARQSLLELGLTPADIEQVLETGEPKDRVTLRAAQAGVVTEKHVVQGDYVGEGTHLYTISNLSKVWVVVDAYESDLAWLRFGQEVQFEVVAYPGRVFRGRVAIIEPILNPSTRTARVRINVENDDLALMPGMFARARVTATLTGGGRPVDASLEGKWMCPMHPEVVADEAGVCPDCEMDLVPATELGLVVGDSAEPPLLIPASAALITGRRAVVYVRLPAEEDKDPLFEGRVVTLGPRAGDAWVVLEGLEEGEQVVVAGAFKIDSELQLKARTSMMSAAAPSAGSVQLAAPRALQVESGALLSEGVALSTAFALDDLENAQRHARQVRSMAEAMDLSLLGLEDGKSVQVIATAVAQHAGRVADAPDLAAARAEFEHLSLALLNLAERVGYALEEQQRLAIFHCPMAFDNRGADWLQWSGTRTENPYFGSGMYRCGKEVRPLPTAEDE